MTDSDLQVTVIGGGLGGLCLAHALRRAGIRVAVYERDPAADARPQGTRLHINPIGSAALRHCLPPHVFDLFTSTCGKYGSVFTVLNSDLRVLSETSEDSETGPDAHWSADRMILRRVLLTGLEDVTHFGKRFSHYDHASNGRFVAHFEDGTSAEADVLVGADGVRSRVRQQYLPHATPFDTGAIMIGAKIPFSQELLAVLPKAALRGGALIFPGNAPCALVMASWTPDPLQLQSIANLSAIPRLPEKDKNGYAVFGFCSTRDHLGVSAEELRTNPQVVKQAVQLRIAPWHRDLQRLAELVDPSELGVVPIGSSTAVPPWSASGVTLMGDAIHSMTPFQGSGANTALKDAQILSEELIAAFRNREPLAAAIERYESNMRRYGFEAASRSLALMEHLLGKSQAAAIS